MQTYNYKSYTSGVIKLDRNKTKEKFLKQQLNFHSNRYEEESEKATRRWHKSQVKFYRKLYSDFLVINTIIKKQQMLKKSMEENLSLLFRLRKVK